MSPKSLFFVLLVISCFSCSSDDVEAESACALVDCATPMLALQFVNQETDEDLFFTEAFPVNELLIVNTISNEIVPFGVSRLEFSERVFITLPSFTDTSESENYQVSIPDVFDIALSFSVDVVQDPCCIGNTYGDVSIEGGNIEVENSDINTYRLLF